MKMGQTNTFAELVDLLAQEAVARLVHEPLQKWSDQRFDYLMDTCGLTLDQANRVALFEEQRESEAIRVAALLGYALAKTDTGLGSYEDWLQGALSTAGLAGYRPALEWTQPIEMEA